MANHTAAGDWEKQIKMQDFQVAYSAVSLIQSVQDGAQKWLFLKMK